MQVITIGLDIAKNVFQVHGIDVARRLWFGSSSGAARCWSSSSTAACLIGNRKQFRDAIVALGRHDAKLGQVRPQCVNQLRALAHQQIARAMLHQLPLLLLRLDGRTSYRLADRSASAASFLLRFT